MAGESDAPPALRVCVVIPSYNAGATVGTVVRQVRRLGLDVVVINDGSSDGTAQAAAEAGALVISHPRNLGIGRALRSGFAHAVQGGYDAVITLDSDGQHDPAEIRGLLSAASDGAADVVMGHRVIDRRLMPLARHRTNQLMSWIVSRLAGQHIPDSQCGFRLIRRRVLETIRLGADRFDFPSELLLAAARQGWSVKSVPIRTIYPRHAQSHIQPIRDGLRFLRVVAWHLCVRKPRRG